MDIRLTMRMYTSVGAVRGRAVSTEAHRVVGTLGGQIVTAVVATGLRIQRREEHLFTDHDDPRVSSPRVATGSGLGTDVPVSLSITIPANVPIGEVCITRALSDRRRQVRLPPPENVLPKYGQLRPFQEPAAPGGR